MTHVTGSEKVAEEDITQEADFERKIQSKKKRSAVEMEKGLFKSQT